MGHIKFWRDGAAQSDLCVYIEIFHAHRLQIITPIYGHIFFVTFYVVNGVSTWKT